MDGEKLIRASDARKAILKIDPKSAYCIDSVPALDAVPVVHGRWIRTGAQNVYGGIEIQCSECGHTLMTSPGHIEEEHFCCKCGAKMDLEVKNYG